MKTAVPATRIFILLVIAFMLSLNIHAQLSGAYTIGKGGDYETFTDAAADLNKVGVSASVTFNVLSGTYTEQFILGTITGTSKFNPVVFQSQSGNAADVTVEFDAEQINNNYIVRLSDCQHVGFKNLTFHATGLGRVFELLGSLGFIGISGCNLSGSYQTGSTTNAAIIFSDGQQPEYINITENQFSDCGYGIYIAGNLNGIPGVNIAGNIFLNSGYTSIYLSRMLHPKVTMNDILDGNFGIHITSGEEGLEVLKNRVATSIEGIKINFAGNEVKGLVANNFISVVGVSDGAGLNIQNSSELSVVHNSVLMNSINGCRAFYCNSNTGGTIQVVNNSFCCINNGQASYVKYPATLGQCDYNNYYSPSSGMFYRGGPAYDIAELKALGNHDQHSVSVYPNYISESDLHANTFWLAKKGTPIPEVSDDIDGDPRNVQHPDIGADEFSEGAWFFSPLSGDVSVGPGETYETLQSLFNVLQVRGISSTLSVRLTYGIHNEQAELIAIPGSSPANRIIITKPLIPHLTDSVAVVYDATGEEDNYILKLHGADFITIRGLNFQAQGDTYGNMIDLVGGADSVVIEYNTFRSEKHTGNNDDKTAIRSEKGYYVHREIRGNTINGGAYGIRMRRSLYASYPEGAVIEGNTLENIGYSGIYLQNHHAPEILSNEIHAGRNGIYMSQCSGPFRIEKNILNIGAENGIRMSAMEATAGSPGKIINNFIHVGGIGDAYGLMISSTENLDVYYNSIHITSTDASDGRAFYSTSGSNIHLLNNIFANTGGGYAYYVTTTSAISGSDYNDIYTTGPNLAMFNDLKTNIDELREGNGYHENCISVDPGFTSDADLHASNEALKGAATPLVSVSDDIDGDLRHLSTPDIGADEFGGGSGSALFSELPLSLPGIRSGKAVWGDYDADGDLDIIMSGDDFSAVYANNGSNDFSDANESMLYVNHADLSWTDGNRDNQPDLFLTGTSPTGMKASVMYTYDEGSFTTINNNIGEFWNACTQWADFDNDGDVDLLVTGQDEDNLSKTRIYFQEQLGYPYYHDSYHEVQVAVDVREGRVAVADYDRDGDMDFVLSGILGSERITRLYENNNGLFEQTGDLFTGVNGGALAWSDFDNDGDPDLLISGYDGITGYVTELYENDEGGFSKTTLSFSGFVNADADWADYDLDGDPDLLISGWPGGERKTTLYKNNNGNSFTPVDAGFPGLDRGSVEWGDCDHDGDPDILLCGDAGGFGVTKVFLNNTTSAGNPPQGPSNLQAQVSDKEAILTWEPGSDEETPVQSLHYNLNLLKNLPSGNQVIVSSLSLDDGTPMTTGTGNMQGNTRYRIGGLTPGSTYIWEVQSLDQSTCASGFINGGSFTTLEAIYTGVQIISDNDFRYGELDMGDYDNDGDLDILICGRGDYHGIHRYFTEIYSNRNGIFTRADIELEGVDQADMEWGDYDNDGDLDFIFSGRKSSDEETSLFIYENLGGSFSVVSHDITSVRKGVVTWGDCDNDGDLDLLVSGCHGSDNLVTKIYINQGDNRFEELQIDLTGFRYVDGGWGDYDHDGDLDVMLSGEVEGDEYATKIYENLGGNSFTPASCNLPGLKDGAVAWGDYDSDGDLDFILTGRGNYDELQEMYPELFTGEPGTLFLTGRLTLVFQNKGRNRFEPLPTYFPGVFDSSVQWGDYDNDGDLDFMITGNGGEKITSIFRNEGQDHFVESGIELPGVRDGAARWTDINNDGTLDIILFGYGTGNVRSYRNNIQIVNNPPESPGNLDVTMEGASFNFQWDRASDDFTPSPGLTYNLRIGTVPGGEDIKSTMSAGDGTRRVVRMGNVQQVDTWTLSLESLAGSLINSGLYWSVQAIDHGYLGSEFATEDSIDLSCSIEEVVDVPHDQGGKVIIRWKASGLDIDNSFLTHYSIWRTIDSDKKSMVASEAWMSLLAGTGIYTVNTDAGQILRTTKSKGKATYWEWVANQPAHKLPVYAYTCATVNDSMAGNDGMHSFMVSAHTSNPDVYFDSRPVSGYSVDNLAPLAPMNLSARLVDGTVQLNWTANAEADLAGYAVYRDTETGIDPSAAQPIAVTRGAAYTDSDLPGDASAYSYVVCAADIHGNLSEPGNEVVVILTGIADEIPGAPGVFQLFPVAIDPSGKHARITFDLAETTHVNLRVIAADGRVLEFLVDDEMRVGRHMIEWTPPVALPPGVYLVEMCTEEYRGAERVVITGR